jgi:hypothetical protein
MENGCNILNQSVMPNLFRHPACKVVNLSGGILKQVQDDDNIILAPNVIRTRYGGEIFYTLHPALHIR